MSIVLPPPAQPSRQFEYSMSSRSTTPTQRVSRPGTPPAMPTLASPISAPSTPVVQTHHLGEGLGMERCHSSEARLGHSERGGRGREPKATSLLFPPSEIKPEWIHVEGDAITSAEDSKPEVAEKEEQEDKMDVDPPEAISALPDDEITPASPVEIDLHLPAVEEDKPKVWGMPRWGREEERKEVRPGVRLVGMEELPALVEQHALLDTPSQILFPWLHGISDDGDKGIEMAAFFGRQPPFEPPSYRGLALLLSPPEYDSSEASDTSSESHTSGTTDATSPSVADFQPEVQMHPCDSKRTSPPVVAEPVQPERALLDSSSEDDEEKTCCILYNSLHVHEIFDITDAKAPRFRNPRLPHMINLRNLNIQHIKYSTISDIILYAKNGVGNGVLNAAEKIAQAQEALWQQRMEGYYQGLGVKEGGEGINEPVRYGVWVLVEPFHKLEKQYPHLVNIDSKGEPTTNSAATDLFEREAKESRAMTRGSEVVEGFWVGNDCDVPGGADDGAAATVSFDVCVKASEMFDMPSTMSITNAYNKLQKIDKKADDTTPSWVASPATTALRNLLSPAAPPTPLSDPMESPRGKRAGSPEDPNTSTPRRKKSQYKYVTLECAGTCRTIMGAPRNLLTMMEKVVELVYFLRRIIEDKDKTGVKRKVLVHCQDGYTESSILVLSYIMSSLSCTLAEAYLHLQLVAKRSFFLYPPDRPLLLKIEKRFAHDRRQKAAKLIASSTVSSPRWKWSFSKAETNMTLDVAKEMIATEDAGGSQAAQDAQVWFTDRRFDGFPSRILPFLYLGNLDHASNARMLKAIGVTHVVSVGESLLENVNLNLPWNKDNHLSISHKAGEIEVLDLTDVRDDGNDPLRPLISRACTWIEEARQKNGTVLVHCRVGVSRSASIVMAYMMQYQNMGLMDAYLITRARRLNVLIQPNLRFFHELFGWEVELAKQQEEANPPVKREILYSWPSFCRDLYCLNRRFLCN